MDTDVAVIEMLRFGDFAEWEPVAYIGPDRADGPLWGPYREVPRDMRDLRVRALEPTIDYRALLAKYMTYVREAEGADFVDVSDARGMTDTVFTDAEWEELCRISRGD